MLSEKIVEARLREKDSDFTVGGEYLNSKTKMKFKCNICNTFVELFPPHALATARCQVCNTTKTSPEEHRRKVKEIHLGKIKVLDEYQGTYIPLRYECLICGDIWKTRPNTLNYCGCPECGIEERNRALSSTSSYYKNKVKECRGSKIEVLGEYVNDSTKILHRCTICKKDWEVAPSSILRSRHGCPECAKKNSRLLRETVGDIYNFKTCKLGKQTVFVQGYEHHAIEFLTGDPFNYRPKEILLRCMSNKKHLVPSIPYVDNNLKQKRYFPDMYIPKDNLLIEVKSPYTLGIHSENTFGKKSEDIFSATQAKAKAAINLGYKLKLILIVEHRDKSFTRIIMPKTWLKMTHTEILAWWEKKEKKCKNKRV
jgi:predicted  nucleic acid-binding Zn-ribbon protein